MNNSPDRVLEDMVRLLLDQVLPHLQDEAVRSQVFAAVFMAETLRLRVDWATEPLLSQVRAQDALFAELAQLGPGLPALPAGPRVPDPCPGGRDLLALRDAGNAAVAALISEESGISPDLRPRVDALVTAYVRRELELERPHTAKPMFAQMSSGQH